MSTKSLLSFRSVLVATAGAVLLSSAPAFAQCDPDDYIPLESPGGAGCDWWYMNSAVAEQTVIVVVEDEPRYGVWETLPFCFCGWYPVTVPCPGCQPTEITLTKVETLGWSVQSTISDQIAFTLKERLLSEIGWTGTLTQEEQEALSGSVTRESTITSGVIPKACFTSYYRKAWHYYELSGATYYDWTYAWQVWCDEYPTQTTAMTHCSEMVASGTAHLHTPPNHQWAPMQPPCGGVPIQNPDPWDGKREEPCCPDVCLPPSFPEHPCCGCAVAP